MFWNNFYLELCASFACLPIHIWCLNIFILALLHRNKLSTFQKCKSTKESYLWEGWTFSNVLVLSMSAAYFFSTHILFFCLSIKNGIDFTTAGVGFYSFPKQLLCFQLWFWYFFKQNVNLIIFLFSFLGKQIFLRNILKFVRFWNLRSP